MRNTNWLWCLCGLLLSGFLTKSGADRIVNNRTASGYLNLSQQRHIGFDFFGYQNRSSSRATVRIDGVSVNCTRQLDEIALAIGQVQLWALRFADAWGGIPVGLLNANLKSLGNYDECIKISKENSAVGHVTGQYCLTQLPLGSILHMTGEALNRFHVQIGMCLPAICTPNDMSVLLRNYFSAYLHTEFSSSVSLVNEQSCKTDIKPKLDAAAICIIIILSLLTAFMVLGTLYDYFLSPAGVAPLPTFVRIFSARTNARQLFGIVDYTLNPNVITCLNGMRCMSLIWVIYGHSYGMALMSPNLNESHIHYWLQSASSMLIQHAMVAVYTFFYLSGLLLVLIVLRDLDKKSGKMNVPLMYLHRYLRLTPLFGIAILVYMSLLPYLGDGPLWGILRFYNYDYCKTLWWESLLYIHNYSRTYQMCMNHTWYLAVDMQLYIISPIFLFALWKWQRKAAAGILILLLLLVICVFSTVMTTDYTMMYKNGVSDKSNAHLYYATHTQAGSWLIGLLFGYYLHTNKGKKYKLNKQTIWLGWLLALALMFSCLFALYPKSKWDAAPLTKVEEGLYLSLHRVAWPLALCWVTFACINGHGGLANSFLSSPLWQPLTKLSYGAYIWHCLILSINAGQTRTNTYLSDYNVMLVFWQAFGFTIILSVFTYLIIEAPLATIESLLLSAPKSRSL